MSLQTLQRAREAEGGVVGESQVCGVIVRGFDVGSAAYVGFAVEGELTGRPPI